MSDTSQSEMTRMHKLSTKQGRRIKDLKQENAKLRGLMSEALSNMEYYTASLGEYWLVQDSDITAMQEALQDRGE